MNSTLHEIGLKYGTDKATFHNFCFFYEKHLPDRSFNGRLLELGVYEGKSLKMWKEYYPNAEIIGIDNDPKLNLIDNTDVGAICGCTFFKRDATLKETYKDLGKFDIIIDDASHLMSHQIKCFEMLFPWLLNDGGYYIIEDLHTSFMKDYIDQQPTAFKYLQDNCPERKMFFWNNKDNWASITSIIQK